MLDMNPITTTTKPWQTNLRCGDVVLYRFPCAEADAPESPKCRPCLVLDVEHRGGQLYAELAYGTSENTTANRGYEVQISRPEAMAAAGLDRPSRFVGARRVTVSLEHSGFDLNPRYHGPVIGRLDAADRDRMNRVRARIHAERGIASDRRRERRNRYRTEAGVVVERRPSRKTLRARVAVAQGRRKV